MKLRYLQPPGGRAGFYLSADSIIWIPLWWLILRPIRAMRVLRPKSADK